MGVKKQTEKFWAQIEIFGYIGYVISFQVEKHNSTTLFYLVNAQITHFKGSTPLLTQGTTATFLFPRATTLKII